VAAPVGNKRAALKIQDQQAQEAHHRFEQEIGNLDGEQALMGKRAEAVKTFGIDTTTDLQV
jgi:hypothetical protein